MRAVRTWCLKLWPALFLSSSRTSLNIENYSTPTLRFLSRRGLWSVWQLPSRPCWTILKAPLRRAARAMAHAALQAPPVIAQRYSAIYTEVLAGEGGR